jgi:hypothetical protein
LEIPQTDDWSAESPIPKQGQADELGSFRSEKMGYFGVDFGSLSAKNGPKTPKKGQKSASYRYLSVNYVILYGVH